MVLPSIGNPRHDKTTKSPTATEQQRRILSVATIAELICFGVNTIYCCICGSERESMAIVETYESWSLDDSKGGLTSQTSEAGALGASSMVSHLFKGSTELLPLKSWSVWKESTAGWWLGNIKPETSSSPWRETADQQGLWARTELIKRTSPYDKIKK